MEKIKIDANAFVYPMPMTIVGAEVDGRQSRMRVAEAIQTLDAVVTGSGDLEIAKLTAIVLRSMKTVHKMRAVSLTLSI